MSQPPLWRLPSSLEQAQSELAGVADQARRRVQAAADRVAAETEERAFAGGRLAVTLAYASVGAAVVVAEELLRQAQRLPAAAGLWRRR